MGIARGPVIQICWVTDDIEKTERLLAEQFGVPSWMRIPDVRFGPDTTTLRGEPVDCTLHVSLARLRKLAAPLERRTLTSPEVRGADDGLLCDVAGRGAGRLPPARGARRAVGGCPGRGSVGAAVGSDV